MSDSSKHHTSYVRVCFNSKKLGIGSGVSAAGELQLIEGRNDGTEKLAASPKEMLKERPHQVYTTMLTNRGSTAIPMLCAHATRLANGFEILNDGKSHDASVDTISKGLEQAFDRLSRSLRHKLQGTGDQSGTAGEICVVAVLEKEEMHVQGYSGMGLKGVERSVVEVRGRPRIQPRVKNTTWVTERANLERVRASDASETVLVDPEDGFALFEGLVTNIYVLVKEQGDGNEYTLMTAPEDKVLPGTVRKCVLEACRRIGLKVLLDPPRLDNWQMFEAAFLTNVLRVVEPVSTFLIPQETENKEERNYPYIPERVTLPWSSQAEEIVSRLRQSVIEIMNES